MEGDSIPSYPQKPAEDGTGMSNTALKSKGSLTAPGTGPARPDRRLPSDEDFFQMLAENASDMIVRVQLQPEFRYEYVSPSCYRITGYTPKEFYADPQLSLKCVHPEDYNLLTALLQNQGPASRETVALRWVRQDGRTVWLEPRATVTCNERGERQFANIIARDVTERKAAEEALRQSEERFARTFYASPLMIILVDLEKGTYLEVNDSFVATTGYTRQELIGHTSAEFNMWLSPEDEARMINLLSENGKFHNQEFSFRMKSGRIRTWLCSAEIINLGGGPCMQAVATDVTEHHQKDRALRQSEERFAKAFHASPESISISTLKDGRFIEVNESFLRDKGYTRAEVIGRTSTELNIFGNKGNRQQFLQRLKKEGRLKDMPTEYRTKTGEIRSALLSAELIAIGNEPCIIFITTDTTRRKKAEAQLRLLGSVTQQVTEATIVADRDFNITYVNEAAQRLLGYSHPEMLGQKLWFANARKSPRNKNIKTVETIKAGGVCNSLITKRRQDGTTVLCECRLSPLYDETGQLQSYIEVQRDVTRQKEIEAKLRVHKRLIESILATMPGGVLVINGGDRVLLANQSFYRIFNIGRKTLKGKSLAQVMPVNQLLNHYQNVKQGQKDKSSLEFRRQVKGIEKIITSHVIPMDGGRTLLTFSDVSKEREKEEKLYLTDRLASLGEMAAGLAHEINNPLTGILALSQLLAESELPAEYGEDVACIHAEAKRAAEIVRNVLLFTRNNNYENGQSSANEVVRDVLRLREYEEKTGNIRVITELEEGLPAIAINRFQLQQVFLNIVSNAEAAIRQTGRPGTLRVTTESAGRYVNVHFADNGCGIKKQAMPRIFDPFFTTKEIGKGTGLGLSICYGIVTKHGGEMNVRSRADQGSTFTIRMPVAE